VGKVYDSSFGGCAVLSYSDRYVNLLDLGKVS